MAGRSTNINFMKEVMSMESNLGNTGVGLTLTSGKNTVALYCRCITVNKADEQVGPVHVIVRLVR